MQYNINSLPKTLGFAEDVFFQISPREHPLLGESIGNMWEDVFNFVLVLTHALVLGRTQPEMMIRLG